VETITAVDVDAGMVEMYKSRIGELGGRHKDTRAVVGDLLQDDTAADEHRDFELITVGAALHAFPSAEDAVKSLAKRLAPGGVLFVQDRFDDGEYGGRGPRGFKEHGMRSYMSDAGLSAVKFEVLPEKLDIEVLDGEMASIWCFIARGMKPRGDKIEK
jgi:SAM-dependent methyltransferase